MAIIVKGSKEYNDLVNAAKKKYDSYEPSNNKIIVKGSDDYNKKSYEGSGLQPYRIKTQFNDYEPSENSESTAGTGTYETTKNIYNADVPNATEGNYSPEEFADQGVLKRTANMLKDIFTGAEKQYGASYANKFTTDYAVGNENREADMWSSVSDASPYAVYAKVNADKYGANEDIDDYYRQLYEVALKIAPTSMTITNASNSYKERVEDAMANSLTFRNYVSTINDYANMVNNGSITRSALFDKLKNEDYSYSNGEQSVYKSAVEGAYDIADDAATSGAMDLERAVAEAPIQGKDGWIADKFVKGTASALQSQQDALLSTVFGVANPGKAVTGSTSRIEDTVRGAIGMTPFATRAAGGAQQKARQFMDANGTEDTTGAQSKYGSVEAGKEVLTELLWGMAGAQSAVTGGGILGLDDIVQDTVEQAAKGLTKNIGNTFVTSLIGDLAKGVTGAAFEGIEEGIGDVLDYVLKTDEIYGGESTIDASEVFDDFLVGAASAIISGGVSTPIQAAQNAISNAQTGKAYKNIGTTEQLIDYALKSDEVSDETKQYAKELKAKMGESENASNIKTGKLFSQTQSDEASYAEAIGVIDDAVSNTDNAKQVKWISENDSAIRELNKAGANISESMSKAEKQNAVKEAVSNKASVSKMAETLGESGKAVMTEQYKLNVSADRYNAEFVRAYNLGKNAEELSGEYTVLDDITQKIVYNAGRMDSFADKAVASPVDGEKSETGINVGYDANTAKNAKKSEVNNEAGQGTVSGEKRNDGTGTGESGRILGTRKQDERGLNADAREKASLKVTLGEKSSAKALGISGGTDAEIRLVKYDGNATNAMKALIAEVDSKHRQGLTKLKSSDIVFFAGGNMSTTETDKRINGTGAKGMYDNETGKIYVRVDGQYASAYQIGMHELTHSLIAENNVQVNDEITEAAKKLLNNDDIDQILDAYIMLYAQVDENGNIKCDENYILEELLCDAVSGLNGLNLSTGKEQASYVRASAALSETLNQKINGIRGPTKFSDADTIIKKIGKAYGKSLKASEDINDSNMYAQEIGLKYSEVIDEDLINYLGSQGWRKVYRAMLLYKGKLYPPMASVVDGELQEPQYKDHIYKADERPDLIDPKTGKFKLVKGDNGDPVDAAYNPYFHTSLYALNDQFTSAYKREGLVVVECYIPIVEIDKPIEERYWAQYAKDPVGLTNWHSGPVAGKLPVGRKRMVYLSQYVKIGDILSNEQVASAIKEQLQGTPIKIPYNVVTPGLRKELEKIGVPISRVNSGTVTEDYYGNPYIKTKELEELKAKEENEYKEWVKTAKKAGLRFSEDIGYHAGDLGKSTVDDYYNQGYSRDTGHFGFGTYFVGDETKINTGTYAKRPHEIVDFTKYNLYKPKSFDSAIALHDALRIVDGYAHKYDGKFSFNDRWERQNAIRDSEKQTGAMLDDYFFNISETSEYKDEEALKLSSAYLNDFYNTLPENYKVYIEGQAEEAYVQSRKKFDETEARKHLSFLYDTDKFYRNYYPNKLDYIESRLKNDIEWHNMLSNMKKEYFIFSALRDTYKDYFYRKIQDADRLNSVVQLLVSAFRYQYSETDINNALIKTREIVNRYDSKRGNDSAATVFMKQLGYEGVDVRHISSLDNTGYGSVIYDLKGDDLTRKNEIGTAKYSEDISTEYSTRSKEMESEIKSLTKQVRQLTKQVAKYKRETQITKGLSLRDSDVQKLTREFIKDYKSTIPVDRIEKDVKWLATMMTTMDDWNHLYDMSKVIAGEIVRNSSVLESKDTMFWNAFTDQLKTMTWKVNAGTVNTKDMSEWRKRYPQVKVVYTNGPGNIDTQYIDLRDALKGYEYSALKEADTIEDVFDALGKAIDKYKPFAVNPFSQDMAAAIETVAGDMMWKIADGAIRQTEATFADKAKEALNKANAETKDAIAQGKRNAADAELIGAIEQGKQMAAESRIKLDRMKSAYESNIKAYTEKTSKQIERMKERANKNEILRKMMRVRRELDTMLRKPTDKKHLPEEFKVSVASVLEAINLESNFDTLPFMGTNVRVSKGTGLATKRTLAFEELRLAYKEIVGELTIDPDLFGSDETNGLLDEVIKMKNIPLTSMNSQQLEIVYETLKRVISSVRSANKAHRLKRWETISGLAEAFYDHNVNRKERKVVKLGTPLQQLIMLDNLTPETYFHMLGNIGDYVFKEMRNAQDDVTFKLKESSSVFEDIKNAKELEEEMHEIEFGGKKYNVSTAQLMDLYNHSRRPQSLTHIYGQGIILEESKSKNIYRNASAVNVKPTREELIKAISLLSVEQCAIADRLQKFLAVTCAKWGNDASMDVYGYEKFGEDTYWPIRSNSREIKSTVESFNQVASIGSKGFTKALQKNATNSIMIGSAFDVAANHIVAMANYSAFLATMEDVTKLYNYKFRNVPGMDDTTTKTILDKVFGMYGGNSGSTYWHQLMVDVANGIKGSGDTDYTGGLFGAWKASAVGANLRVILQQPTAILRAMAVVDPKYFVQAANGGILKGWSKAKKYSGIAQWKDWGYFDIQTGRQIKDVMFNTDSTLDKTKNAMMAGAGFADSIGWGMLWNVAEAKVKDSGMSESNDGFYEKVADVFDNMIDKSQVVDGVLQRSHIMRKPGTYMKMLTAFMGEPTKQYNMMVEAIFDHTNNKSSKALARSSVALLVSGAINALAQSVIDGLRHRDRDKDYLERVIKEMIGYDDDDEDGYTISDFADSNANIFDPASYIPWVKDVKSILDGYDVSRTDMELISTLSNATKQWKKAMDGDSKYTKMSATINFASAISSLFGVPISNLNRDVWSIVSSIAQDTNSYYIDYQLMKLSRYQGNQTNRSEYINLLYEAYVNDKEAYQRIYDDMIATDLLKTDAKTTKEYIEYSINRKQKESSAVK